MTATRVLLVSTYDLGRQPLGLAGPTARLRAAGADVQSVDVSREPLSDEAIAAADAVAFFLPMHTATRLALPLVARVRRQNPAATVAAYGLYAPLNESALRELGVQHVVGPRDDGDLVRALTPGVDHLGEGAAARSEFVRPDRASLLPLARYAALQLPDGTRRVVGNTDASTGCKHLCRHCPVVPVHRGKFRAVPVDVVLHDVRQQVAAGAQHVSFGDPDFFNGPTHARRVVELLHTEHPDVTYDVTIKIEHLLAHAALLPVLRDTGCLFVTSAVESVDDAVLATLRKGHTRADFVRAVGVCRDVGLTLSPTFVPFAPWTTPEGYLDLLDQIATLGLVDAVAPVQLGIRLLVTAQSALLEVPELRAVLGPYDAEALVFPWSHQDPMVDELQRDVMRAVAESAPGSRAHAFAAIVRLAERVTGRVARPTAVRPSTPRPVPPYLTEGWYCCAEPGPEAFETV